MPTNPQLTTNDKGKSILRTFSQLVSNRAPYEEAWRSAFEYSYPERGQQLMTNESSDAVSIHHGAREDKSKLFDCTGKDAVRLLAASIQSGLTPPNMQWFTWSIPDKIAEAVKLNLNSSAEKESIEWLQASAKTIFKMIHSSNFDAESYDFILDLVVAGQCGLYVELVDDAKYHFEFWPLATMYIQDTLGKGKIDTVYRRLMMTPSQVINKWGAEALTQKMKDAYERDPYCSKQFKVIHCIRPRILPNKQQATGKLIKTTLPYESIYVAECGTTLHESGYHECPIIVPRWKKIPLSDYAVGPYDDALPDVKSLNYLVKMQLTNADMKVSGMYVAKDDGVLNPNTVKIGPRRIVIASDTANFKPLTVGGDWNVAISEYERMERNIRRVMMSDQLQPTVGGPMQTATEVTVRLNMVRQMLGPVYGRFSAEYLEPLLSRCFGLALRAGLLGAPPDIISDIDFYPEYQSPLARAQRQEDVAAMDMFEQGLANAAKLDANVLDQYDTDAAVRLRATLTGLPEKLLRDPRKVKEMRKVRAEQQEAQQQVEQEAMLAKSMPK